MPKASILDKYPNIVRGSAEISLTAGTIGTLYKISTQYNPKDMLAMLVQRIVYTFDKTVLAMDAVLDMIEFGIMLFATQPYGGVVASTPGVLDYNVKTQQYGTSVGGFVTKNSVEKGFTDLQGGGLVCHPASLYVFGNNKATADFANAVIMRTEVYYTLIEISPTDWQEMWQLGYINTTI